MKYILISLFFSFLSFSQGIKNNIIKGILYNCDVEFENFISSHVRLKKEKVIVKDSISLKNGEFYITELTKGNYNLEFVNVYGQTVSKEIELKDTITEIKLCFNDFIDTGEKTTIESLNNTDVFEILILSTGCFHFEKDKILFYYKKKSLYAEFYRNSKKKKKIKLDNEKLSKFILFERMVLQRDRRNKTIICTSSTNYTFNHNGQKKNEIFDGTCDWDGYYDLINEMFNEE
jgi:hypothetical protein